MTASTVIKWHGGKAYLADWIISHFPPHLHYVEPFFGGGSVLFAKPPELVEGHSEVAGDRHYQLTNFWHVLQDASLFSDFQRQIEATPFSEIEWHNAAEDEQVPQPRADWSRVESAVAFFIRCRQSLAGRFDSFAPLSKNRTRRGMNEQASAWWSAVEGLPAIHARLGRVVIRCVDALKLIAAEDGPQTLYYLDPPYLHGTRSTTGEYAHEMIEQDHADLLLLLSQIDGKFVLSGYPSQMYEAARKAYRWRVVSREIDNKAAGGKSKAKKTECLWMNF